MIREEDLVHNDHFLIEKHILNYFTNIFGNTNGCIDDSLTQYSIPNMVT